MKRHHVFTAALLAAFCISCLLPLLRAESTAGELDEAIIRLHIVASSDSEEHQRQKLLVRDAVQDALSLELIQLRTREQALEYLRESLPAIECIAEQALRDEGSFHTVDAALARKHFPLRNYGGLTIPAGRYTALTLTIGAGQGRNWWCVMYPPMCYAGELIEPEGGEEYPYEAYFKEHLSEEALRVLHTAEGEEIVYRSRLVEELGKLGNTLNRLFDGDGE